MSMSFVRTITLLSFLGLFTLLGFFAFSENAEAAPTITVTEQCNGTEPYVVISWGGFSSTGSGYTLERRNTFNGNLSVLGQSLTNTTFFDTTGIPKGVPLVYRVNVPGGEEILSDIVIVNTYECLPASGTVNVTANLPVSWTIRTSSDPNTTYSQTNQTSFSHTVSIPTGSRTFTITASHPKEYPITISTGSSFTVSRGEIVNITITATPPPQISATTQCTPAGGLRVTVGWLALQEYMEQIGKHPGEVYNVYRTDGGVIPIKTGGTSLEISYVDTEAREGQNISYSVSAIAADNDTYESTTGTITTPICSPTETYTASLGVKKADTNDPYTPTLSYEGNSQAVTFRWECAGGPVGGSIDNEILPNSSEQFGTEDREISNISAEQSRTYTLTCNNGRTASVVITRLADPISQATVRVTSNRTTTFDIIQDGNLSQQNISVNTSSATTRTITLSGSSDTVNISAGSLTGYYPPVISPSSDVVSNGDVSDFTITYTPIPPQACSIDLNANGGNGPVTIDAGQSVELSWVGERIASGNSLTKSSNPTMASWSGTMSYSSNANTRRATITPTQSTTFTLTGRNSAGESCTDSVEVVVRKTAQVKVRGNLNGFAYTIIPDQGSLDPSASNVAYNGSGGDVTHTHTLNGDSANVYLSVGTFSGQTPRIGAMLNGEYLGTGITSIHVETGDEVVWYVDFPVEVVVSANTTGFTYELDAAGTTGNYTYSSSQTYRIYGLPYGGDQVSIATDNLNGQSSTITRKLNGSTVGTSAGLASLDAKPGDDVEFSISYAVSSACQIDLRSQRTSYTSNDFVLLSWNATSTAGSLNASSNPNVALWSGSKNQSGTNVSLGQLPVGTYTFTLSGQTSNGVTCSDSVTVTVVLEGACTLSFSSNKSEVRAGEPFTLTWSGTNLYPNLPLTYREYWPNLQSNPTLGSKSRSGTETITKSTPGTFTRVLRGTNEDYVSCYATTTVSVLEADTVTIRVRSNVNGVRYSILPIESDIIYDGVDTYTYPLSSAMQTFSIAAQNLDNGMDPSYIATVDGVRVSNDSRSQMTLEAGQTLDWWIAYPSEVAVSSQTTGFSYTVNPGIGTHTWNGGQSHLYRALLEGNTTFSISANSVNGVNPVFVADYTAYDFTGDVSTTSSKTIDIGDFVIWNVLYDPNAQYPGGSLSVNLSAPDNRVSPGEDVYLQWQTTGASSCVASGGWSGSREVANASIKSQNVGAISNTTTYTLTCYDTSGNVASDSETVYLDNNTSVNVTLTANPTAVSYNGSTELEWTTQYADTCTASGDWSGSKNTANTGARRQTISGITSNKQFTLTCRDSIGNQDSDTVTITVSQPPELTLTASPSQVVSGGATILTWTTQYADTCTASGGWSGTRSGSESQNSYSELIEDITSDTTFTLKCFNTAGASVERSATVTITTDPGDDGGGSSNDVSVDIDADPNPVEYDEDSRISWNVARAESCLGEGSLEPFNGLLLDMDSFWERNVRSQKTYTIRCVGELGASIAQDTEVLNVESAPDFSINVTPQILEVSSGYVGEVGEFEVRAIRYLPFRENIDIDFQMSINNEVDIYNEGNDDEIEQGQTSQKFNLKIDNVLADGLYPITIRGRGAGLGDRYTTLYLKVGAGGSNGGGRFEEF